MSTRTEFLRQLADAIDQGAPYPVTIAGLGRGDVDVQVDLQHDNADISWWVEQLDGTLAFQYVKDSRSTSAKPYAMHEVVRPAKLFAGCRIKAWATYNLTREVVGADGCGCPVTDLIYANGSNAPEGHERTEHVTRCALSHAPGA